MGVEIERKFLVDAARWQAFNKPEGKKIYQGYLSQSENVTVRIRVTNGKGFITIKSAGNGITRTEYEYEIPEKEAEEMLQDLATGTIAKIRYEIFHEKKRWEIDEFLLKNKGLIIAEIELKDENESFTIPSFILEEVTGNPKYYNAYLAQHPYLSW